MGVIENKMRSDLGLRGMRPNTVKTYVRCCRRFVKHYGRSPLDLTSSDVRAYLEHLRLTERKAPRSINVYAAALAFLFGETLNKALRIASQKAGVKHVSPHTLRHCFATSLLELGADLRMVQLLLGHCTVRSTVVYLHISQARLAKVKLPIDTLGPSPDAG